jgi:hypothetical protein
MSSPSSSSSGEGYVWFVVPRVVVLLLMRWVGSDRPNGVALPWLLEQRREVGFDGLVDGLVDDDELNRCQRRSVRIDGCDQHPSGTSIEAGLERC